MQFQPREGLRGGPLCNDCEIFENLCLQLYSEGVWQWADGTPWSYTNWVSGQPNNGNHGSQHHLVIRGMAHEVAGQWLDVTETVKLYFICQY